MENNECEICSFSVIINGRFLLMGWKMRKFSHLKVFFCIVELKKMRLTSRREYEHKKKKREECLNDNESNNHHNRI